MIKRLHELQSQEATSHFSATHTSENLPQDSQAETAQTSSVTTSQQDTMEMEEEARNERAGESSRTTSNTKPTSLLGSAQKNGGRSSSSARLLPGFVYQVAPDSASRETEDMQGGRGGGKKRAIKENGRKAKQKLNFANSSDRSGEDAERTEASEQPASTSSWSEMSSVMIGTDFRLSPLSPAMEQRLILQYLTPLGDYQEVGARI